MSASTTVEGSAGAPTPRLAALAAQDGQRAAQRLGCRVGLGFTVDDTLPTCLLTIG
ncbi:MAG: hypothetical protein ACRDYX_19735 [Egibacteraceae bacterium]